MKKALAIGVTALGLILLLLGCADNVGEHGTSQPSSGITNPQAPSTRQPSILVNDTYYFITGRSVDVNIDENDYLGVVTSEVPLSEIPTKNEQSNFVKEGTPYADYEDGIVVLIDGKWIIFELWDDELVNDYVNH